MGTFLLYGTILIAILDLICGYYLIGISWLVLIVVCYKFGFFKRLNKITRTK